MRRGTLAAALLVWLSLASPPLLAEAGWTSYAYVSELIATNQFRYLVTLQVSSNPSGCKEKKIFYLGHSALGPELMFRTLLEAVSGGKRVRVYVTGNCDLNGYSEISSVSIVP